MTLLSPGMLWFAALLVPLAAVYLLKVRPVRRVTPTLFLWDEVVKETSSRTLFRRLRDLLSLLLLAGALLAVVGAMARPVAGDKQHRRELVLLLDVSASMGAGGDSSRLEEAKDELRRIVRALPGERRASLATVAGELRTVVDRTADHRSLIDAIDAARVTDEPLRVGAIEPLARDVDLRQRCRVILATDGCFDGAERIDGIEVLRVGEAAGNIGIVAADLMSVPDADGPQLEAWVRLASSYPQPQSINLLVCRDQPDNVVKVYPVTVEPGIGKGHSFRITPGAPGRWLVRIDQADALDADNTAWLVAAEAVPIGVGIATESDDFFYHRCVEAFATRQGLLKLSDPPEVLLTSGRAVDVGGAPTHIIFRPTGESPFWSGLADAEADGPVRLLLPEHQAVRFADLEAVPFVGQQRLTAPPGSVIIAESLDGLPLVYEAFVDGRRAFVVNMDPARSELFLSAYFPVLVYSMARSATGAVDVPPASVAAGRAWSSGAAGTLRSPSGSEIPITDGESPVLRETGFGQLVGPRGSRDVACSLLSPADSMLGARAEATVGPLDRGWSMRSFLLAAALLVMAAECILYHRRKVG